MTITSSHDLGETVHVLIDGVQTDCLITEVRVLCSSLTSNIPVVTYQGVAEIELLNPDGKKFTTSREWMGNDSDIKG